MRNTRFEVRPTSGALGAELLGIDLSDSLDAESAADIRQTLNEHGVIFFRDQRLSPEQHIAFAERMGPININRFFKTVPGYPQIAEVRKEPAQTTNIGGGWQPITATTKFRHSDRSCWRARFQREAVTLCLPAWRKPTTRSRKV